MPVKPAVLENERISTAQDFAPAHSYIEWGMPGVRMNASYAASKTMSDLRSLAQSTQAWSWAYVATAPVGLLG